MHLLDINVWLALAFDGHQNHNLARTWFEGLPVESRCYFCRYTQMGFMRIATNARANPLQTLSLSQVWAFYDQTMLDVRIGFSVEPKNLENEWRQLVQVGTFTSRHWNDAYLAAFALAADFELITIDKGFSQFKNLRCTILSGQ